MISDDLSSFVGSCKMYKIQVTGNMWFCHSTPLETPRLVLEWIFTMLKVAGECRFEAEEIWRTKLMFCWSKLEHSGAVFWIFYSNMFQLYSSCLICCQMSLLHNMVNVYIIICTLYLWSTSFATTKLPLILQRQNTFSLLERAIGVSHPLSLPVARLFTMTLTIGSALHVNYPSR